MDYFVMLKHRNVSEREERSRRNRKVSKKVR